MIVNLRSLPAIRHSLPATEVISPVKYLIRSAPEPVTSLVTADAKAGDPVKRGVYLVNMAACGECHTPQVQGQPLPGIEFGGGFPHFGPWGNVFSANITPDPSGIQGYDEALFLQVMRAGYVKARKLNPIMPVSVYKNLDDDDLKAIFACLRTVKPVKHRADNTEVASVCRLCKQKHGAGQQN